MSGQYPPSSPIAACDAGHDDPFYQPNGKHSLSTLKFFKKKPATNNALDYPTPNPSSTLDRSSPIKTRVHLHSSQTPSECELEQELRHELKSHHNLRTEPLEISLDARFETRVTVGRKSSLCDVVLPRHKNVSRLHAFVTYSPETEQVKIECKGTNGLIVVFPVKLDVKLLACKDRANTYNLVNYHSDDAQTANKELVRETELTSFVLLQEETVHMPYVEGTILDFRPVQCELILEEYASEQYNDPQNETETEDELQALQITSDDFPQDPHTPTKRLVQMPFQERSSVSLQSRQQPKEQCPPLLSQAKDKNFLVTKLEKTEVPAITELKEIVIEKGAEKDSRKEENRSSEQDAEVKKSNPAANEKSATNNTKAMKKQVDIKIEGVKPQVNQHKFETGKVASERIVPATPRKQVKESSLVDFSNLQQQKTDENGRRRKYASPSPKKTHKRKNQPKKPIFSKEDILLQVASKAIDICELQHVLANHLAFSNVQQVPLSQLRDVNSIISTLKPYELRALLEDEKCIGVIYREGKDAAGKPLDAEYYYDLENDSDENRRQLVSSLKGGRSGLRSCRRVHKQYFWKKPTK
ncbi:LANO_0G01662g1_1 [Lachancea nothofagi CBS 11611]|uniref:LANO_0G01662g1_1 n=1 Tax=Lachancea nothofagi CBS 11611 TaxID=1266666 RepID=A0A1G4KEZ7_9SACH|nr:LANO_0G01662g1_1 [Lachancea nothofagi CBS 11611]